MKSLTLIIACLSSLFPAYSFNPSAFQRTHLTQHHKSPLFHHVRRRLHEKQQPVERKTFPITHGRRSIARILTPISGKWLNSFNCRFSGIKLNQSKVTALAQSWLSRIRRMMLVFVLVAAVWSSSGAGGGSTAHASTSPASSGSTQIFHEKIVDNYVKRHMFDDEMHDAVSSTYREAHYDKSVGTYPSKLQEVTTSVVGESGKMIGRQNEREMSPVASALMSLVSFLEKRGMSQMSAIILLTAIVFTGAPIVFLVGSMAISLMFKRGIAREMKARYGENYTIDATIKKDEEVEAPEDEDDEEDDDDDSDSDDPKGKGTKGKSS